MALAGFFLGKRQLERQPLPSYPPNAKIKNKGNKNSTPQYTLKAGTGTSLYISHKFTVYQLPKQSSRFTPDVLQDVEFFLTTKEVQERPVAFAKARTGGGLLLAGNTRTGSEVIHKILVKLSTCNEKLIYNFYDLTP
jgi:hypothetical protein